MRVTQSMIVSNTMKTLNRNRTNLATIQSAISTGKQVRYASDNPISFSRIARYKDNITQNRQLLRNIEDAISWTETTDQKLNLVSDLLMDANDVARRGADGTSDTEIRGTLATRVEGIIEEVLSIVNDSHMGKKLFAGTETKSDGPFVSSGSSVTYNGNDGNINRRISQNLVVQVNIDGQQIIDSGLFDSLYELRDALAADDQTAIQASISSLDSAKDNVLSLASGLSSTTSSLRLSQSRLEDANISLTSYISDEEDVNIAEAMAKYESEQLAYEASLQTASKIMNLNILNFLT